MRRAILAVLVCWLLAGGICEAGEMTIIQILTPDEQTFNLDTGVFRVYGIEGLGMPGVRVFSHQVPGQPGGVLDDMLDDVRTVIVSCAVTGADAEAVFAAIHDVAENFRYNRTANLEPLRLRVTEGGNSADLYCYYGGQIVNKLDYRHAMMGFTLVAYDPYWYATSEISTAARGVNSLDVSYIMAKIDGTWSALGNAGAGGGGGVYATQDDGNGNIYMAGAFTSWDSDADQEYITLYDLSEDTWSDVGGGLDEGWVNAMALSPDGTLYIGGVFSSDNGSTPNTRGIIAWDGSSYSALGTGCDDNYVSSLAMDSDGNLYAGGFFTGMGGVANTNGIAKWNGTAWSALGTGADDGIVYGLAIDASDNLYATGSFTGMGGVANTAKIAKWNGTAWTALGTGLNNNGYDIAVDSDGMVYVCGAFTTANGITVSRVAAWDGATFDAMNGGLGATCYKLGVSPDDQLYVFGAHTVGYISRWNGSNWLPPDFIPPGSPSAASLSWDSADNFYVGFNTTGEATAGEATTVTTSGTVKTFPTLAITGPGTLVSITNGSTDQEISANLYINDGETITIDLGDPGETPAGKSISTDWATRPTKNLLLGSLLAPVELATFALEPAPRVASGQNKIGIFMTGTPVESGDNNTQLSRWAGITGLTASNTDDGRLYVSIVDEGGGDFHVNLYSDSARSALVGHTATYSAAGSQAITADNTSGLGGTLYVDAATAADVDIAVDFPLATITHYNRYDSLFAAVD